MRLAAVITAVALVAAALVVSNRLRKTRAGEREDTPALEYTNTFISAFYLVLLALIVVLLWQNVDDINTDVGQEATDLKSITMVADRIPGAEGVQLRTAARDYAKAVVDTEWPPSSAVSSDSGPAADALRQARTALARPISVNAPADTVGDQALTTLDDIANARDDRLGKSTGGTPSFLLYLLVGLSLITVITPVAMGMRADAVAFTGLAVTAVLVCLSLWFVMDLQTPFHGILNADSSPLRDFLDTTSS